MPRYRSPGLTPKEKLFVEEYLIDQNGARAAREAGYTKVSSRESARKLLTKVHVREAIDAGLAAKAQKAQMTADEVLKRIAEIAKSKTAKNSDVLKACDLLGKYHKLFTERQEISGPNGGPQVILTIPRNGSERDGND